MASRAITIRVGPEAAQAYEAASAEERRKLDVLLSLKLTEATKEDRTLEEIMRDISWSAQIHGLTPDMLKTLLDE